MFLSVRNLARISKLSCACGSSLLSNAFICRRKLPISSRKTSTLAFICSRSPDVIILCILALLCNFESALSNIFISKEFMIWMSRNLETCANIRIDRFKWSMSSHRIKYFSAEGSSPDLIRGVNSCKDLSISTISSSWLTIFGSTRSNSLCNFPSNSLKAAASGPSSRNTLPLAKASSTFPTTLLTSLRFSIRLMVRFKKPTSLMFC
mmetsp:Transcript_84161/g.132909  ORF Transcript_84161/g.132909 Transcript_84161/m.132909 type:complete len:207 (-) Transcript_84161:533-1153(-)